MLLLKKTAIVLTILLLNLILAITPTWASVQIDAQFKATKTCEASKSTRLSMNNNSSKIYLIKGKVYHVIAKDRNNESHYLIEMPDQQISPSVRWIARNCGEFTNESVTQSSADKNS